MNTRRNWRWHRSMFDNPSNVCQWKLIWCRHSLEAKNCCCKLGNSDIDFFNFRNCQVWNFKISNLFEKTKFCNHLYQNQNWKSKKYLAISQKSSITLLKFHAMSLVLWNLINYCYYCKISQFMVKFCKSPKYLGKKLLNDLEKQSNIPWILLTFIHAIKKGQKLGNFCP